MLKVSYYEQVIRLISVCFHLNKQNVYSAAPLDHVECKAVVLYYKLTTNSTYPVLFSLASFQFAFKECFYTTAANGELILYII